MSDTAVSLLREFWAPQKFSLINCLQVIDNLNFNYVMCSRKKDWLVQRTELESGSEMSSRLH